MPLNDTRTVKYFFNQIYNNGRLIEIILPLERIKKLDKLYKVQHANFSTFEDFESAFPNDFIDFKKSKSAYKEIQKQFRNCMGLQPSILTECFVAQTLADHLHLDEYIDLDDDATAVPNQLLGAIFAARRYNDGSKFRYCYYNNHFDALVFQCGASGTVDIVFAKYNVGIRIEIKEQLSKLEECDITGLYDESGKLQLSEEFCRKREKYVPFIHLFNASTDVFKMEGHNFNFSNFLGNEKAKLLVSDALDVKVVDLFILVVSNKLVPVLSKNLFDFVNFKGSEIRTAGRNYSKVFTPKFVKKKIYEIGGTINNEDVVQLPYNPNNRVMGRNLNEYRRYNIGSLLFVKLEDTEVVGNFIKFSFDNIYQKKPSISVHLNAKINEECLLNQYLELNGYFH